MWGFKRPKAAAYQKCPVCNGETLVPKAMYHGVPSANVAGSSTLMIEFDDADYVDCRTCGGAGVLACYPEEK